MNKIIKDIKYGFLKSPALTVYRLVLWPFVWVLFLLAALLAGFASAIFNLSLESGVDAFLEVISL